MTPKPKWLAAGQISSLLIQYAALLHLQMSRNNPRMLGIRIVTFQIRNKNVFLYYLLYYTVYSNALKIPM